jgi:hypothetical protein
MFGPTTAAGNFYWISTRASPSSGASRHVHQARVGSLLEDSIHLESDRDLVAERDATAVHWGADVDAEVAPADLRGHGKPGLLPDPQVRAEPLRLAGHRHTEQIATVAVDLYRSEGWGSKTDKAK